MAAVVRQTAPIARLFQDVVYTVVAFLPPQSLAVLKMVCRFFAQSYQDWGMCISELSASRRFANAHIGRAPHQNFVEALCFHNTFAGPVEKGYYRFNE